jgi:hypothetical protein
MQRELRARPLTTVKLMVHLVFGLDDDADAAAKDLRKAGYIVHQTSAADRCRYGLTDHDLIEAVIVVPDDEGITDAVLLEVETIIRPHGGFFYELSEIDDGYIPFERKTTPPL